ncbi:hypothetical protein AB0F42_24490 [Streptomyces buecherae]|uniref:hypothetical protein n=1 Tax=Streptomyces buecherae TaxID=2763006 RepID=UPI0033C81002
MAEINPPAWMQAGSYPARNDRLSLISAFLCYPGFAVDESTPLRIRQGVKPSYQNYQLKVRATSTPSMNVIVSAGTGWIDNHDVGGFGSYCLVNDADRTLAVAPAGGAGQYRRDAFVAALYDAETGGASSEWRLEVVQGPYAASAGAVVLGTLPTNGILLGSVLISPGQTSITNGQIFDARNFSVAAGGILPVPSNIAPNRPHPGQMLYMTDTDRLHVGKMDGALRQVREGVSAAQSTQSAAPPLDQSGAYVDFLAASWPPVTVTVPVSGQVKISIGGEVHNSASGSSTASLGWRATGASSVTASIFNSVVTTGGVKVAASRVRMLEGMTPGASLTITPQWRISSGSPATSAFSGGVLTVEPIA